MTWRTIRRACLAVAAVLVVAALQGRARAEIRGLPINLGDSVNGVVDPGGDRDTFTFDALFGMQLSLTLAPGKDSALLPEVTVLGPDEQPLDLGPFRREKKGKVRLKKLPLRVTGRYAIRVSAVQGTDGAYVLKTKPSTKSKEKITALALPVGGTQDVYFPGAEDSLVKLKIASAGRVDYDLVRLTAPGGVDVTRALDTVNVRRGVAKLNLLLGGFFGDFALRVGNAAADTSLTVTLKAKHRKAEKRKLTADAPEPSTLDVDPPSAAPGETVTVTGTDFVEGSMLIRFGDAVATRVEFVSATELRTNVPVGAGGTVTAETRSGDGDHAQVPFTRDVYVGQVAKHVVLLIGDGMQLATEIAGSRYLTGGDRGLVFHGFPYETVCATWDTTTHDRYARAAGGAPFAEFTFDPVFGYDPVRGGALTYDGVWEPPDDAYFLTRLARFGSTSTAFPATDSAASASAIATGRKTEGGRVAWRFDGAPDGALRTFTERLRDRGGAVGVVTTDTFAAATSAAFVSHATSRAQQTGIAHQIAAEWQPDVVLGAGHPSWLGTPAAPNYAWIAEEDYTGLRSGASPYDAFLFVERTASVDGGVAFAAAADAAIAQDRKLFGLFGGRNLSRPIARDAPGSPGFDFAPAALEDPTVAEAATAALRVVAARGGANGFFLLVECHDTDPASHDNDYERAVTGVFRLDEATQAVIDFVDATGDAITWDNTLVLVTSDHGNGYLRLDPAQPLGKGDLPLQQTVSECGCGPSVSGEPIVYPDGEALYSTGKHTNEPTMLYARGAGSAVFANYEGLWWPGTRLIDNTHVHEVLVRVMDLE